jgi:hypothetical protein
MALSKALLGIGGLIALPTDVTLATFPRHRQLRLMAIGVSHAQSRVCDGEVSAMSGHLSQLPRRMSEMSRYVRSNVRFVRLN